jgi:hypothetical protein
MKVKFLELTEAFVQTIQTPLVYGGLQGQPGYASPTIAPQSVTQPIYPVRQSPQTATAPQIPSGKVTQSQDAAQVTGQAAKAAETETAPEVQMPPKALPYPQTATQQMSQSGAFGGQPKPGFVTAPSTPKLSQNNLTNRPKVAPAPTSTSASKTQYQVNREASDVEFEKFKAFQARKQERAAILAQTKKAEAAASQPQIAGNVQETVMRFKPNSLKSLLNDAWDPKNPFGPLFPQPPKPTPVTPSGPYVPTPGGVKPKNPKVVTPKRPGISGKVKNLVNQPTPQLLGGVGAAITKDAAEALKNAAAFLSMPPSVAAAAVSGRLSGLGYDKTTQADYTKYYKEKLGTLGGIAGAVAGKIPVIGGVSKVLGKAAGLPIVSDYIDAASTEAANLMTGALYDPRAISRPVRLSKSKQDS